LLVYLVPLAGRQARGRKRRPWKERLVREGDAHAALALDGDPRPGPDSRRALEGVVRPHTSFYARARVRAKGAAGWSARPDPPGSPEPRLPREGVGTSTSSYACARLRAREFFRREPGAMTAPECATRPATVHNALCAQVLQHRVDTAVVGRALRKVELAKDVHDVRLDGLLR
jgi:hypothetical protein